MPAISPGQNIKSIVESGSSGDTFTLTPGALYTTSAFTLDNKKLVGDKTNPPTIRVTGASSQLIGLQSGGAQLKDVKLEHPQSDLKAYAGAGSDPTMNWVFVRGGEVDGLIIDNGRFFNRDINGLDPVRENYLHLEGSGITAKNCYLKGCLYYGIDVKNSSNIKIEKNSVVSCHGGAVYHHNSVNGSEVAYNYFEEIAQADGVQNEDGVTNVWIHHNVMWVVGENALDVKSANSKNILFEHNVCGYIMALNDGGMHRWFKWPMKKPKGVSGSWTSRINNNAAATISGGDGSGNNVIVRHNLFYNCYGGPGSFQYGALYNNTVYHCSTQIVPPWWNAVRDLSGGTGQPSKPPGNVGEFAKSKLASLFSHWRNDRLLAGNVVVSNNDHNNYLAIFSNAYRSQQKFRGNHYYAPNGNYRFAELDDNAYTDFNSFSAWRGQSGSPDSDGGTTGDPQLTSINASVSHTNPAGVKGFNINGANIGGSPKVAKATNSGSGSTSLNVDIPYAFQAGWGPAPADYIQIGNQDPIRINSISGNTINLAGARSWSAGDDVNWTPSSQKVTNWTRGASLANLNAGPSQDFVTGSGTGGNTGGGNTGGGSGNVVTPQFVDVGRKVYTGGDSGAVTYNESRLSGTRPISLTVSIDSTMIDTAYSSNDDDNDASNDKISFITLDKAGQTVIDVTGSNSAGSASGRITVDIAEPVSASNSSFNYGSSNALGALSVSGGHAPITYHLTNDPTNGALAIDANGQVTVSDASKLPSSGSVTIEFEARDANNGVVDKAATKDRANIVVNIQAQSSDIITLSGNAVGGQVGQAYQYQVAGSDTLGHALKYSLASGNLPPGLSINANGQLTGTPTQAGTFNFRVRAEHQDGSIGGGTSYPGKPYEGMQMVFNDEFEGSTLDTTKWDHYGLGVRKGATNVENAVSVENGKLKIRVWTENGKAYTGMISTRNKFEYNKGYIEFYFKPQQVYGAWSAGWVQSSDVAKSSGNAVDNGVEMDVFEALYKYHVSDPNGVHVGFHWDYGQTAKKKQVPLTYNTNPSLHIFDGNYHKMGMMWDENGYKAYLNDQLLWTPTGVPISNHDQFIIISMEVADWGNSFDNPPKTIFSPGQSPGELLVDYVRVYQAGNGGGGGNAVTAERDYTITIDAAAQHTVSLSGSPPEATVGTAYSYALVGSDSEGHTLTYAVVSGALPAGLSLSSAGVISGMPTTQGTATFRVRAQDGVGGSAEKAFSITVNPAVSNGQAPTFSTPAQRKIYHGDQLTIDLAGNLSGTTPISLAVTSAHNILSNVQVNGTQLTFSAAQVGSEAILLRFSNSVGQSTGQVSVVVTEQLVETNSTTAQLAYSELSNGQKVGQATSEGGHPPVTYRITDDPTQGGFAMDSSGALTIADTSKLPRPGQVIVKFTATDANG